MNLLEKEALIRVKAIELKMLRQRKLSSMLFLHFPILPLLVASEQKM